jgi:D-alanyl-lipoteichoic acid acyltransferase DltB (MBOAT superfamily)
MIFTQFAFFVLLAFALSAVALTARAETRKFIILGCSFVFYGWWDWRFLGLVLVSTTIDFLAGLLIESARRDGDRSTAKLGLTVAVSANLLILGVFKYFDFFSLSIAAAFAQIGIRIDPVLLYVVLPVGISFYTFHAISYAVDVYRGNVAASRSYLDYLNFVMFFPQLVAGPIARASHLLPQVKKGFTVQIDDIYSGSQLFLFGLVKKLAIADNLAPVVDRVFSNPNPTFIDIVFGGLGFMSQIYCDFSGYTDMARGTARMFGISLADNFKFPFLVANPRDFWHNWHISLSTWLRDYLFIPLGGSHGPRAFVARNLMITMLLGGLWHGASWNFVLWGAFHGAWLVVHRVYVENGFATAIEKRLGGVSYKTVAWLIFTALTVFGWIIFRCSQSAEQLVTALSALAHPSLAFNLRPANMRWIACAFLIVAGFQLWQRKAGPEPWKDWNFVQTGVWYVGCLLCLMWFDKQQASPFIYFQF